jgi:NAD(P)-dependent dehydrogenase (short-subunit alcohol dehydrogenase family)
MAASESRFAGKVALVTGAASGIGRATAVRLADEGASVVISDIDAKGLHETALQVGAVGGECVASTADVSDPASVAQLVARAGERFGGLDVLANVAGIVQFHNLADIDLATWNRILAVNLTGTFLMCQTAMDDLLERGGTIVNVASTSAERGHPWMAAYAASKGGVMAFSKALAIEFGKQGVRTNIVVPGSIITPMQDEFSFPDGADEALLGRIMPLDRARGPEYVASVIAFLASDDAAHMCGSVVRCDGGTLS